MQSSPPFTIIILMHKKQHKKERTQATQNYAEWCHHIQILIQNFISNPLKYKLNNPIYTSSRPKLNKKKISKENKIPKLNRKNKNTIKENIFLNYIEIKIIKETNNFP